MIFFYPFYYIFKDAPKYNIHIEPMDYLMLLLTIIFFCIPWCLGLINILNYIVGWR